MLQVEQQWCYLTHSWEEKGVHTFPKGIFPKVIIIARLEYEFAYYNSGVKRFNPYTTRTLPSYFHLYLDCEIVVSDFKLQLCYYAYFRTNTLKKDLNPLFSTQLWVN